MPIRWIVLIVALLGLVAADPAWARHKSRIVHHCRSETSSGPSWNGFLFNQPPPPNGCAPPVYVNHRYIGQDPDPFIRQQLRRDPRTGYFPY